MGDVSINYESLFKSLQFYKQKGFHYRDVSWAVPPEISALTKPEQSLDFYLKDKVLVASAEQSFLYELSKNNLPKGRYCAITPCFRDEIEDELHKPYFMKVELIDTKDVSINSMFSIINTCQVFFTQYLAVSVEQTGELTYDIVSAKTGIELGSYGIRTANSFEWIYATGCAEPRLSYAMSLG